jgi:hypothetical protein
VPNNLLAALAAKKKVAPTTLLVQSAKLPFDAGIASQRDDLISKLNQSNLLNQQQSQKNTTDVVSAARNMMQAEPGVERGLLSNYAGRGMAFSSGYGQAYGDTKAKYATGLADLLRGFAGSQSGLRTNKQQNTITTQALLDRLIQQQAANASGKSQKNALAVAAARSLYG